MTVMPSTPIPAGRQLPWQLAAARLLTDLLAQAAGQGLPVVVWEIGEVGPDLLGHCYGSLPHQRRQVFEAWHRHLSAAQPADRFEEQRTGDLTLLIAQWKRYQGVNVTLRAEIDALRGDEQGR
jgi:hypothetical protein